MLFVNRMREMVSFELGKEIEKDVYCLVTSVGQKQIFGPHEESNISPSDSAFQCSTTERSQYEVHMTRILHTARISKVDSVMFVNRIREMVSFELAKEIERDVFRLVTSVG